MFLSEVLQTNAYRVLRLSASATYSDVHKAADSFKRLNTLGLIKSTEIDLPQLGPISRSESDIRSAVNRMETPACRLQDRLFWFHLTPKQIDQDTVAHLLKKYHGNSKALAALSHDGALHTILAAVVSELDEPGTKLWVQALRSWHEIVSNEDYWALFSTVEARGRFEPAALPSEISKLRDSAVRSAAQPLILATRDAQIRSDSATVRRVLASLDELSNTGSWAELAQDEIVSSALVQFKSQCEEVSAECNGKIIRTNEDVKNNKLICDASIKRYREEVCPSLDKLLSFFPAEHRLAKQEKEEAATQ